MKPTIDSTSFGSITIAGRRFDHDVFISLDGDISKRKKKLSKAVTGTSHIVSRDEAAYIHEAGAEGIIIGNGQSGALSLSAEAAAYFNEVNCPVQVHPTPKAIRLWNDSEGKLIALFHLTC
jgi:hypothetical protein